MLWRRLCGWLVLSALAAWVGPATAAVRVSGTPEHIALQTQDASIADVLSGLEATLDIKIALTGSTDRRFTGIYSGSLRAVLARLLGGLDHLVRPTAGGVNVIILGPDLIRPSTRRVVSASRAGSDRQGTIMADDGEPPEIQGWVPTNDPYADARAAAAKTARAAGMTVAQISFPAEDSDGGVQGWVPTKDPYADARAAAAKKATAPSMPAAQPDPLPEEPNSGVQGWIPTHDPYAATRAAAVQAARENAAKAAQQKQAATDKPVSGVDALMNQIRNATSFGDERRIDLGPQQEERSGGNGRRLPALAPSFAPLPQSSFDLPGARD